MVNLSKCVQLLFRKVNKMMARKDEVQSHLCQNFKIFKVHLNLKVEPRNLVASPVESNNVLLTLRLLGTHRRSLIFQLFITVTEIEHHISYLTFTEHYRWPDFSCINCWFNTGCPERQFAPPNLAAVADNVHIHLCCGAFIDWFLTTYSVSHQQGFLGVSVRILHNAGRLFCLFSLFHYEPPHRLHDMLMGLYNKAWLATPSFVLPHNNQVH